MGSSDDVIIPQQPGQQQQQQQDSPPIVGGYEMRFEKDRLDTFANWPTNAKVEARKIAKAGFFHTGQETQVQCLWCGSVLSEWDYGDQVRSSERPKTFDFDYLGFDLIPTMYTGPTNGVIKKA